LLILSLDTTTRAGSAAVTDDDRVLAARAGDAMRSHGERLPGEIDAVLAEARVERDAIDLLVIASGPGAFTGLRIGLAAMQGLAMTLDRPIIGVSALDALAWTVISDGETATAVATWMDAQRGEVFSALYRPHPTSELPWTIAAAPAVGAPDLIVSNEHFDRREPIVFLGDGARRYVETITAVSPRWSVSASDPLLAPALAWIGRRLAAQGHATTPHALQPLYVRRPDAEIERDRLTAPPTQPQAGGPVGRSAEREGGS
jgi:tRNA threonylcarbamoyladenosine biosynthesis protein TsaB